MGDDCAALTVPVQVCGCFMLCGGGGRSARSLAIKSNTLLLSYCYGYNMVHEPALWTGCHQCYRIISICSDAVRLLFGIWWMNGKLWIDCLPLALMRRRRRNSVHWGTREGIVWCGCTWYYAYIHCIYIWSEHWGRVTLESFGFWVSREYYIVAGLLLCIKITLASAGYRNALIGWNLALQMISLL